MDYVLLMLAYFLGMIIISLLIKTENTKRSYLVNNGNTRWIYVAMSMSATWVWAPSLFIASEIAYTAGWVGVFWFTVPNVLTFVLFGYFASKFRKVYEEGVTFSDFVRKRISKKVHNLFLIESFGLQVMSYAVQILAGGMFLTKVVGLDFIYSSLMLAFIPLIYSLKSGIKTSIYTDVLKMGTIVVTLLAGIPILIASNSLETITQGLTSVNKDIFSMFSGRGLEVSLSFGIPTAIGLLSGAFGDQMFWQRVFSVEAKNVKKTMLLSAGIFAIVPISLSLFGLISAGYGLEISNTQLTNYEAIKFFMPNWFLYLFFLLIISGLSSTLDSILNASASVASVDVVKRMKKGSSIREFDKIHPKVIPKVAMMLVASVGFAISNIKGITIVYLFLIYGTLRSSVMLPTIMLIMNAKINKRGIYVGMLSSLLLGLPLFAYYKLNGMTYGALFASLLTASLPLIINCIYVQIKKRKE